MPRYVATATVVITLRKEFEAADEGAARDATKALVVPHLCVHCATAGEGDPERWELTGSIDGEPEVAEVVRA